MRRGRPPDGLAHARGQLDRPPEGGRLVLGLLELLVGTEPATIPAPVWTWAWPLRRTAYRIVIAVSRLPSYPR